MAYFFEVTLVSNYFNQQNVNVWNYIDTVISPGNDPSASALLAGLGWSDFLLGPPATYPAGTVAKAFIGTVNPLFQLESVLVRDIYSNTNLAEIVFPVGVVGQSVGSLVGEACSPTTAVGYNTTRVRADIGRGQKRIGGVTEGVLGPGGLIDSAAQALYFTPLAVAMSQPIDDLVGGEFIPAVLGKERYEVEVDGVPTGRFAYRYWTNPAAQESNAAVGVTWGVKSRQRTQVSRQYGRGR